MAMTSVQKTKLSINISLKDLQKNFMELVSFHLVDTHEFGDDGIDNFFAKEIEMLFSSDKSTVIRGIRSLFNDGHTLSLLGSDKANLLEEFDANGFDTMIVVYTGNRFSEGYDLLLTVCPPEYNWVCPPEYNW